MLQKIAIVLFVCSMGLAGCMGDHSLKNKKTENMDVLVLSAKIKARAGKIEVLEKELRALIAPTRAEKGCLSYALYTSRKEEGVFLFFESWASRAEWEAHMETEHLKAFFAKEKELVEEIEIAEWKE